jgi:hypothetical protein
MASIGLFVNGSSRLHLQKGVVRTCAVMIDEGGRQLPGACRNHEIFDLKSELVV